MAIDRERAALTAPDRAKLTSGSEQAALPATGISLALVAPADANWPTPPERAPREGTFAGFTSFKTAPKPGLYTISLSAGAWGRRGPGRAFPQTQSLQRRHRLRRIRKTMKYELSASPRAASLRHQGGLDLDRDPAVGVRRALTSPLSLLLFSLRYPSRP